MVGTNISGIPDVALSSNIPLKNGTNTFTGDNTYTGKNLFLAKYDATTINLSDSPYCSSYSYPNSYSNIFIGKNICNNTTSTNVIQNNVFIGNNIATGATNVRFNISIGNNSLQNLQIGDGNLAYGLNAIQNLVNGSANLAFGNETLFAHTLGSFNLCMGASNGANMGSITGSIIACDYNLLMGGRNISFGNNIAPNKTICNKNIALGFGALSSTKSSTSEAIQLTSNVAIGYFALGGGSGGASYIGIYGEANSAVGDLAGFKCCGTSSYCSFLGANADVASQSTVYTQATCIGANSVANSSNSVNIGTASDTTYITGALNVSGSSSFNSLSFTGTLNSISASTFAYISGLTSSAQTQINNIISGATSHTNVNFTGNINSIPASTFGYISGITSNIQTQITNITIGTTTIGSNSQYMHSAFGVLTGSSYTLTSPYSEIYSLAPTSSPMVITLPTASSTTAGLRFQFRRTGGTTTVLINSNASNIYPNNSLTATNAIMGSSVYSAVIYCAQVSATPTYGWFFA
jgi:hypothetical protein